MVRMAYLWLAGIIVFCIYSITDCRASSTMQRFKTARAWKVLGFSYLTFFIWNIATTSWLYFSTPFGMWFAVLVNSLLMACSILVYHLFARKATQAQHLTFLACLWIGL